MRGQPTSDRRVVVVGGGITGLSCAHRLLQAGSSALPSADVLLLESSQRLGGQVFTERVDGCLLEAGPDTLVTHKPAGLELCRRLGLDGELVRLESREPSTEILHRGRLVPVPEGFVLMAPTRIPPLLSSRLFSLRGKARLLLEPWVPARENTDETLGSFVTRRFGSEVLERVAGPILAGLFLGDPERLSLRMTMPRFLELERRHGSVTRGLRSARRMRNDAGGGQTEVKRPPSPFVTLRGGLATLVDRLAGSLSEERVRTGARTGSLRFDGLSDTWRIAVEGSAEIEADAVVLACPAHAAAGLLEQVDPELSSELRRLDHASCATVNLLYRGADVGRTPSSNGFFVPRSAASPLIACSFVSEKFPDRVAGDGVLIRAFVGGIRRPDVLELDDEHLARLVHAELGPLLEIRGEPVLARSYRFPRAMPQCEAGHHEWLAGLRARLERLPGLFLAGSALGAVGLPDCIASGEQAATRAQRFVERRPTRAASMVGA